MASDYYFGFDLETLGPSGSRFLLKANGTDIAINNGTFAHVSMAPVTAYTEFAARLQTALGAGHTVTYNPIAYTYTVTKSSAFSLAFPDDAAGRSAALILGFTPGRTYASATSHVSDRRPGYLLLARIDAQSRFSEEYEPNIAADAEADNGATFGITRTKAPIYLDWAQMYEETTPPSSIASRGSAVFRRDAQAPCPWSWQDAIEHARGIEPIYLRAPSTPNGIVFKLRAESTAFKPMRVSSDLQTLWNFDLKTRLLGRIEPRVLKALAITQNNLFTLTGSSEFPGSTTMTIGAVFKPGGSTIPPSGHLYIWEKFTSLARGYRIDIAFPSPTYDRIIAAVSSPAQVFSTRNAPFWDTNKWYSLVVRIASGQMSTWLNGSQLGADQAVSAYVPADNREVLSLFRALGTPGYQCAAATYAHTALSGDDIAAWHAQVSTRNDFDFPGGVALQVFDAADAEATPGVAGSTWKSKKSLITLARTGAPAVTTHINPVFA